MVYTCSNPASIRYPTRIISITIIVGIIMGIVMLNACFNFPAPSRSAASYRLASIAIIAEIYTMEL